MSNKKATSENKKENKRETKQEPKTTKPATKPAKTSANFGDVFIPLGEFDITKMVIQVPVRKEITDPTGKKVTMVKARFLYENEEGELCIPYVQGPDQDKVYFSFINPFGAKPEKDEHGKELPLPVKGYQVNYNLRSWVTRHEPTPEEQAFKKMLDEVCELVERVTKEDFLALKCIDDPQKTLLPSSSVAFINSPNITWLKPMYNYPFKKDNNGKSTKELNFDKSETMYVKLLSFGQTSGGKQEEEEQDEEGGVIKKKPKLVVLSKIWDIEGGSLDPADLCDGPGKIKSPIFKFESVYYGTHGNDSTYGASIHFRLSETIYTPSEGTSVPSFLAGTFKKDVPDKDGDTSSQPPAPKKSATTKISTPEQALDEAERVAKESMIEAEKEARKKKVAQEPQTSTIPPKKKSSNRN
jgi:hypothetical protein